MADYFSFTGRLVSIEDWSGIHAFNNDCSLLISLIDGNGATATFVVSLNTYFVHFIKMQLGDRITAFYDANVPVPLIYPPRYQAVVITEATNYEQVKVSYFDRNLVSSDNTLKLNIGENTEVELTNGQTFPGTLANRNLIVVYTASTRSIPAQTTPEQVIVLC